MTRAAPLWFAALFFAGLLYGVARLPRPNVVTEHHVAVRRQLADGDWLLSSDEERSVVFRPCSEDVQSGLDVNGLLTQAVGWTAERAVWEERGTCKSILRPELGFWFRDEANNFTYERTN